MTRAIAMRIILIVASIFILVSVTLLSWVNTYEDDLVHNNIEIDISSGKTKTVHFDSFDLVPGDSCEYGIILKNDNANIYNLTLDFVDFKQDGTLKDFMRVKILSGETVLYDELLADVFKSESIIVPVDFKENKNTKLKIVYYLPIEVGNEAKNAEASFELRLTASNE